MLLLDLMLLVVLCLLLLVIEHLWMLLLHTSWLLAIVLTLLLLLTMVRWLQRPWLWWNRCVYRPAREKIVVLSCLVVLLIRSKLLLMAWAIRWWLLLVLDGRVDRHQIAVSLILARYMLLLNLLVILLCVLSRWVWKETRFCCIVLRIFYLLRLSGTVSVVKLSTQPSLTHLRVIMLLLLVLMVLLLKLIIRRICWILLHLRWIWCTSSPCSCCCLLLVKLSLIRHLGRVVIVVVSSVPTNRLTQQFLC